MWVYVTAFPHSAPPPPPPSPFLPLLLRWWWCFFLYVWHCLDWGTRGLFSRDTRIFLAHRAWRALDGGGAHAFHQGGRGERSATNRVGSSSGTVWPSLTRLARAGEGDVGLFQRTLLVFRDGLLLGGGWGPGWRWCKVVHPRRVAYPCRKARCLRNTELRAMQRKQG